MKKFRTRVNIIVYCSKVSLFTYIYNIIYFLDFWKIIEKFNLDDATFNYLVRHGLNSKANKESLIALYLSEDKHKKLHYYEFPTIKEIKWRSGAITKYDIPQYINDIPEDFPTFCTMKEFGIIKNYSIKLKKDKGIIDGNKSNLKFKENKEDENFEKNNKKINLLEEPIPNHKFCQLCKKDFDNYVKHIKGQMHKDNEKKYTNKCNNIKNIFRRVNEFWENENDKKDKGDKNTVPIDNIIITEKNIEIAEKKFEMISQMNQNTCKGCNDKKINLLGQNSQLSTSQSFSIIPHKKRMKKEYISMVDKKIKSSQKIKKNIFKGNIFQ